MPHARRIFRCLVVAVWALVFAGPFLAVEASAGQQALFDRALEGFKYVQSKESRAMRRDLWQQVHDRFQAVFKAGPDTGYAPKSLYYMGRCYEELATRSGVRSDAHRAVDYFQRAAMRFANGHSWIDDCLYRKAELEFVRLGDARSAAADLRTITRLYAKGDQAGKARRLLARIEGRKASPEAAPAPKAEAKAAAKATAEPARSGAGASSGGYGKTVRDFRALRADKKATREDFQRIARRFEDLNKTLDGVYGARSAYFAGYAWDELGRRSGRDNDFMAAVSQYERAVQSFRETDSWRDDALFRKGYVEYKYLNDEDQAYADLLLVVRDYPDGDQATEAKALLRAMDEARAGEMPDAAAAKAAAPIAPEVQPANAGKASFGGSTGDATLQRVRHFSGDDFTRVVLDLDNAVRFKERSLPADPSRGKAPRMFVDLEKTRLGAGVKGRSDVGGFLRTVRAAQNTPDTVRVVLDFEERQEYHILTLENPYRIVIDVFASKTAGKTKGAAAEPAPKADEPERTPGKEERDTAADVLAQLGLTIRTVMIDAGHGGRDPGALQYVHWRDKKGKLHKKIRTKEKDITLRLAGVLGKSLEKKGFKVLYTRPDDVKVPLEDRVLKANIKKADLFISLHCNANNSSKVRGFETYYLGRAKNNIVLRLAAKENDVDPKKISDTQKIVLDLVHSFKIAESRVLAKYVQSSCVKTLKRKYKGINDHGSRSAPFFVLIGAKMPAVLVEVGYITNSTEAKLLRSDAYLQSVSDGIVAGVEAYRKELRTSGL